MTFADRYGNAIDFLMEKGNPAIQYRTMIELCEQYDVDVYRENLAHSERAVKWLDILRNHKEYHGATIFSVENSLNVLTDMGFRAGEGFREFDLLLNLLAEEVYGYEPDQNHILHNLYCHLVTVPFLARAGLLDDWIYNYITDRIEAIHHFVVQGNYDIYTDGCGASGLCRLWQHRTWIMHLQMKLKKKSKRQLETDFPSLRLFDPNYISYLLTGNGTTHQGLCRFFIDESLAAACFQPYLQICLLPFAQSMSLKSPVPGRWSSGQLPR